MPAQGISTRSVDDATGMSGISEIQVCPLCEKIDERVQAFPARLIERRVTLPVDRRQPTHPGSITDRAMPESAVITAPQLRRGVVHHPFGR